MEKPEEKKVKAATVILALAIIIAAYIFLVGISIYYFNSYNAITAKTARVIPYPAAIAGKKIILIRDIRKRLDWVKRFYENQDFSELGVRIDFSTPEGEKRMKIKEKNILTKLIENAVIESAAEEIGVVLTPEMISQEVDREIKKYGSEEETRENLEKLYGWTISDFKQNVVKPDLYREKVEEYIRKNDPSYQEAEQKISLARDELKRGDDFKRVAEKFSEGESSKSGGELGWFRADQMLPEISEIAFTLEKGQQSEIIASNIGYHIIEIEDAKNEEGISMVKIRQIFVRTKTFYDWLAEEEQTSVKIFIREFFWDKSLNSAQFWDKKMKEFEENIKKTTPDDISIMF